MNLVEFWQAPLRKILGSRDLASKDLHRNPEFVARVHRILKGREKALNPESEAALAKIKLARLAIATCQKKVKRLTQWVEAARNELMEAQARGDDLLRELHFLEHGAD